MLRAAGLRLRAVTPRCRLRCQLWDKRATALEQRGVPARPAGSRPVEAAVPSSEMWICEALLCEGRAGAPTSGRRRGNESGSTPEPGRGRAAPAGWRWFAAAPAGETLVGARSVVQTLCGARRGCEMRVPPTHTHSPVLELARSFSGQAAHFFCFSYWVNHATLSWPSRSWWVLSTFDLSCRCCGRCRRGLAGSSHSFQGGVNQQHSLC